MTPVRATAANHLIPFMSLLLVAHRADGMIEASSVRSGRR
jgi:hypothetical protein